MNTIAPRMGPTSVPMPPMVTMGGIGTLVGPIIGAMVFILIQEILSSYTEHWMIFTGAIFVLMVIFLPGGLVGTARRLGVRG